MAKFYFTLTLLGIFIPYGALLPWLFENGFDIPALLKAAMANPISIFAWLDVVVAAIALVGFIVADAKENSVPHWWLAIVGTFSVGVSCGLPLYLYLKVSHQEKIERIKE
ncbi:DUF2834 domain-containing protein [Vibrio sp. T187]|uniref:DUF2834 domain-containing protein n=1 Tax=Vibrio TaxID=662 RepID=UPI0010C9DF8C|nr:MULTISPECIES: DUF2834 domain-containing protein [Vibrio]MBW3698242.1 DUF2834 domain-containing protein [Vibrio sp. T187]